MDLFNLSAILSLDKSGFDRGVDKADRQGRGLAKSLGKTIGGIGKSFLAMSAAAVGAFAGISTAFYSQVKAVSAYGDAVDKQSQKLGMSRRNYQMWGEILAYSGTSIDTMTMGMKTLNNAIVSGSKEGREAFSKLGLSEKELAKMSQEDAFATVVSAFQKMPEGAEKSALAVKLFGRNGQELLPTLNMTAEEMSALEQRVLDLGSIMGDDAVADSARFNDSLQDVSSAMRGFRNRIFASFLPSLSLVNEGLAEFIAGDDDGLEKIEEGISEFVDKLSSELPKIINRGGRMLSALWGGVTQLLSKLWPKVVKFIGNVIRDLPKTLDSLIKVFAQGAVDLINEIFGTNIKISDFQLPSVQEMVNKVRTWWETSDLADAIKKTCSWVLGVFTAPEENLTPERVRGILETWWNVARKTVQTACSWVLGLFSAPSDSKEGVQSVVGGWWMRAKEWVTNACSWVLKIFNIDIDGTEVFDTVHKWWEGVKQKAGEALDLTLSALGLPTKEEIANTGMGTLSGILDTINTAWQGIAGTLFPTEDFGKTIQTIGTLLGGVAIAGAVDGAIKLFNFLKTFTLPTVNMTAGSWIGAIATIVALIAQNWDTIEPLLEEFGKWASETFKPVIDTFNALAQAIQDVVTWVKQLLGLEPDAPVATGSGTGNDVEGWLNWTKNEYAADERIGNIAMQSGRDVNDVRQEIAQKLADAQSWAERQGILQEYEIPIEFSSAIEAEQQLKDTGEALDDLDGKQATVGVNVVYRTRGGKTLAYTVDEDGTLTPYQEAKGLDYIPTNDYLTRLHRGEAVLSANEARAWRESGGRGQSYGDSSAIVSAIQGLSNDMQNLRLYVGERAFAGAVVDYSGRRMNDYLGESSTRSRRGYGRR